MPRDLDVSFLAVDEIQIAADLERGHVFTDRILNRRGRDETLLLGAATMRPIIERLLPGASIVTRPRLSQLEFAGDRKITRQPRRTAIVAFSADEVYAIAELIRRQHGGAAVVLGSLSPRTRNAQVAMFQNGDVDYLVATDAVGMGLNLDVDHVAFASDRKYDGYQFRRLNPSEFAQIAGRAGRATRDGTFGTTGRCAPFEPELVNALQNHTFDSVKVLQWRNSKLDFSSLGALQVSLALTPAHEALTRAPIAEDLRVLDHAARDADVREMAHGAAAVERLWDACQIPDYRKIAPAAHAELVTTLFGFLMQKGRIPDAWFAAQVDQADRVDGDIDTLSGRIAQIRTWTFVANRPDWLADPEHWQGIAREVENKLSDALHERLTERFVDRRTSVLMRRLRENTMFEYGNRQDRRSDRRRPCDRPARRIYLRARCGGSRLRRQGPAGRPRIKALAGEIDARAEKLGAAPDEQFVLTSDGTIRWTGDAVAKLVAADDALHPRLRIIADERLSGAPREAVQTRLDLWLKTHIEKLLGPLFDLDKAEDITGIARGIAFQLIEALGVLERTKIAAEMKDLDQPSRASLRKYGVRFGAYHIYLPALLKPAARALASLLWAQKQDNVDMSALSGAQHLAGPAAAPRSRSTSSSTRDAYRVLGYRQCGERAVRVDILERLADLIRPALAWRETSPGEKPAGAFDGRGFVVTQAMTSLTGSAGEDFASILRALGYRMERRPPLPPKPVGGRGTGRRGGGAGRGDRCREAAPATRDVAGEAAPVEAGERNRDGGRGAREKPRKKPRDACTRPPNRRSASTTIVVRCCRKLPSAPAAPRSSAPAASEEAPAEAEAPPEAAAPLETPAAEAAEEQAAAEAPPKRRRRRDRRTGGSRRGGSRRDAELRPRPRPPPRRNWSTSGGPAAARTSAGRVTIATAIAISRRPQEGAAAPLRPQARPRRRWREARAASARTARPPQGFPQTPPRCAGRGGSRARAAEGAPAREPREDKGRPPRERFEGKGSRRGQGPRSGQGQRQGQVRRRPRQGGRDRGRDKGGRDKRRTAARRTASMRPARSPRERDRPIDPNSPFAKLAALKEQLTANRKDQLTSDPSSRSGVAWSASVSINGCGTRGW